MTVARDTLSMVFISVDHNKTLDSWEIERSDYNISYYEDNYILSELEDISEHHDITSSYLFAHA